ncbi:MAG: ribosomal protein L11 methyltransferase [Betaproteobacteria bacterium RIFCSPLOWO2_12_FULL_65_14]|nr:MAG: ribosomal protein L11 methyltransferase [Betaproteobacteria bacterium RIFCSPLOWO2_12_FULL_65_14]
MPWHALELEVDAAAAEALSEALLESGAQSVALENLERSRQTLVALIDLGTDAQGLVRAAAAAAGLAAAPAFTLGEVADEDWVRRSQAQFLPTEIGTRLWIGPTWQEPPLRRLAVRVDPGLAFGTGTHPTTKLVLRFLERHVTGGERVLDYGCGSGILAIAASKLGAACVDAVDVDPQAVETAAANARANGAALRAALPEALPAAQYDIVVSNILAQPLIALAPLLAARTAAHGRIALAGILEPQAPEVIAAYRPWFEMQCEDALEGWALLAGKCK